MKNGAGTKVDWLRWGVHLGALAPLGWLGWSYLAHQLTANPVQALTLRTGKTALSLLVLTLACTPLDRLLGFKQIGRHRRTLGLYTFFYTALHFSLFVYDYGWFGKAGFKLAAVVTALGEKRFLLVGVLAGVILLALAATSFKGWQRRLGQNWNRLHRLIYAAGLLAVWHYAWAVKADLREPLLYGSIVGLLLGLRLPFVQRLAARARLALQGH